MRRDPLGIAVWMAADASICHSGWEWEAEQWVSDHVLAHACLASFHEFLDIAVRDRNQNRIAWNGHVLTGWHDAYWAVIGRNTPASPIRIYQQLRAFSALRSVRSGRPLGAAPVRDHLTRLSTIKRQSASPASYALHSCGSTRVDDARVPEFSQALQVPLRPLQDW